ncbi:PaaI family thioesterase [Alkalicoccus chagannorensis]|uniref:PaaI family thioesterase n=1 Tax=Alkalicoccus chagannorensis TaxID=427072 RepID=UPI00047C2AB2|nr:PaaI family thioesterase [Alkalicoccus chagannorensis]
MTEEELQKKTAAALEAHRDGGPDVFLYSLFDFAFDYDTEQERVHLHVPVTEMMLNPIGFIHGGLIAYIADSALGHLCAAFTETPSVSLELKTQFLRSKKSGTLRAEASFLKKGKNIQFTECSIYDEEDNLMSVITGTFYALDQG